MMELVNSRVAGGFYFRRCSLSIEAVASVLSDELDLCSAVGVAPSSQMDPRRNYRVVPLL
jgi:hypothetical protein